MPNPCNLTYSPPTYPNQGIHMEQLGGLDNLMIEGELPDIPMHMSAVLIYDTGTKAGTDKLFEKLRYSMEELMPSHFPILRARLESVPLELDKAYWIEDTHFNVGYHLERSALPGQRDWAALHESFSHFHAQPLDRARPLWQVVVVEGLDALEGVPAGATALFLKIHHAMMDGKSALRLISAIHATSADEDAPLIADSLEKDPAHSDFTPPTWWEKYGRAWWHSVERPLDLASTLVKLVPDLLPSLLPGRDDHGEGDSDSPAVPQLHFNHPVSGNRVTGHLRMSLRPLNRLVKKHSVSINDIALAVVAGALRYYLQERDELPDTDTLALMPIDIRRKGEDGQMGNHVAMARVPLFTTLKSPWERLLAIHGAAQDKKRRSKGNKGHSHLVLDLVDDIHPALILWLGNWLVASGKIDELPQSVNTAVTNVPGLRQRAWLGGAELVDYLGFGPLAPNMGLFHTVSSTSKHVNISFLSTPEFLDDGAAYQRALEKSWRQMVRL